MGRISLLETVLMTIIVCVITVDTVAARQDGCCFHDQYEGHMFIELAAMSGFEPPEMSHIEASFSLDHKRRMVAMNVVETWTNGDIKSYKLIEDFYTNKAWYFLGGVCYHVPVRTTYLPAPCIPANAKRLREFSIGTAVQTWALPISDTTPLSLLTVGVDGCVPIQATTATSTETNGQKHHSMVTVQFGNLTKGIADPTVFDVPKSCKQ